ncbi:MAG: hypothetical protein R2792_19315 [Saprospiraceae bacterium]
MKKSFTSNYFKTVLFAGLVSFGMQSCTTDSPGSKGSTFMDEDLINQVKSQAPNGEGLAFFTMPESDDYDQIPQDPRNPITVFKCNLAKCSSMKPDWAATLWMRAVPKCIPVPAATMQPVGSRLALLRELVKEE